MATNSEIYVCPLHPVHEAKLNRIEAKQDNRPCIAHDAQLLALKEDTQDIKEINKLQQTAIDSLKRMVYMGAGAAGVLAFLGSVIGQIIKRCALWQRVNRF